MSHLPETQMRLHPMPTAADPTMPSTVHGEVAGSFLLGLVQSFYNLSVLPQGGLALDFEQLAPHEWYPHTLLIDALHSIRKFLPQANSLMFRAGMHFLRIWYEQGPGKDMIHSTLDWFHAHDAGAGYNSVVRGGTKDEIGWSRAVSVDVDNGIAVFENVMPLPMEFVKGVFYGGCLLFDDVDYVSVEGENTPYEGNPTFNSFLVTVRFRLKPCGLSDTLDERVRKMQTRAPLCLSHDEHERMAWRYKWNLSQRELDSRYFNDINSVLSNATLASQNANRALEETLAFNRAILLNSPFPMAVYSAAGNCIEANDAFCEIMASSRDKLLHLHNIADYKSNKLYDAFQKALGTGEPQQCEIEDRTLPGRETCLNYHFNPVNANNSLHVLVQIVDLTVRKQLERELHQMAYGDALTKLPNRRLLMDRVRHAISSSKRNNSYGAVLFLDLNRFKHLNDTHGHEAGDQLLMVVADRLRAAVRDADTVARLGGDEFVVMLEGLGAGHDVAMQAATMVAEKIRASLTEEYVLGDIRHRGSASIGIALFLGDSVDAEQLLKNADDAMYDAKRARSNTERR